jgi:membrane protease YdiL (CAAX protease family)
MATWSPDHYQTLGVAPHASQPEIDEAYRRWVSWYEAAREKTAEVQQRFEQARAAYEVLHDPQLRALYDMRYEAQQQGRPAPPGGAVGPVPWGIPAILAALAVPLLLWLSSLILTLTVDAPDNLSDADVIINIAISVLILDGAFVAAPLLFCFARYKLGWSALGMRPFASYHWWIPAVVAGGAYVATIAYVAVLAGLGFTPEQDTEQLFDSTVVLPATGIATVIIAPLAEEIFFRGFVFTGLIRHLGAYGAMAASGLLFAMFHVQDAHSAALVPPFAIIGALFAYVYYRTGSLWTSIGAHFVFNSISFIFLAAATIRDSM